MICFQFKMLPDEKNGCACEAGWQGERCDKCVPYWDCPNKNVNDQNSTDGLACLRPNQCFCKLGGTAIESDDKALCNNEDINGVGATDPNA